MQDQGKLTVNLGKDSYPIYIENQLLRQVPRLIQEQFPNRRVLLLSDDQVFPLYGPALEAGLQAFTSCTHLVLPHGEPTKAFENLRPIYTALLEAGITRSDLVIALGGGVIGDLGGYAAASYLRGVDLIQIPTSLLAQVDSSVGGKVAVDLPQGKNLVGAFFQPKAVYIDPSVLSTLPKRYLRDGMGEVIKYGCIKDISLFLRLEEHPSFKALEPLFPEIITRCVDIKRRVVEADPFDRGERMLLNFGHTLAHTIEQYTGYRRESHGEAVAIGMVQISRLAETQGLTPAGTSQRIARLAEAFGLPTRCGIPLEELAEGIGRDKKNLNRKLNLILLQELGQACIYPASPDFFSNFPGEVL